LDASDAAHPDEVVAALPEDRLAAAPCAGRSVAPELAVLELAVKALLEAGLEPCRPDAVPSAA